MGLQVVAFFPWKIFKKILEGLRQEQSSVYHLRRRVVTRQPCRQMSGGAVQR
jgi:hypothetical protein